MPKKLDIVGNIYGRLTVVESMGIRGSDKAQYVRCICSCGGDKITRAATLTKGKAKSCGCLHKEGPRRRLEEGEASFNKLIGRYKRDAISRGLTFSLTGSEFRTITKEPCHYCGAPPQNEVVCGTGNGTYIYSGIDRKDSSLGYEVDNVVACCIVCNKMKMKIPYETFISKVQSIYKHLQTK